MKKPPHEESTVENPGPEPVRHRFQLYVSGATPRSAQAIANIKAIGQRLLQGDYDLEVIDACQQAELLRKQQIVVLPTLIKRLPLPIRRMVGDLSDTERVLLGLGLDPDDSEHVRPTQ